MLYPDKSKRTEAAATPEAAAGTQNGNAKKKKLFFGIFARKNADKKGKGGNESKLSLIKIMALQFAIAAFVFCVLLIFRSIDNPAVQKGYDNVMKAFLYNIPVSENDDDIGKIKFVDKIKENAVAADTLPLEIGMPVSGGTAEAVKGVFSITGYSNSMVFAPERGAVKAIGLNGGARYIDIQHPGGVVSRLQGIATSGVKINESVKKGQPVGMAQNDGSVVFCLFKDNRLITSAVVSGGKVEW